MKRFKSCPICGEPVRVYRSRQAKFCSHSHYVLFVKNAKTLMETKKAIFDAFRREKTSLIAP